MKIYKLVTKKGAVKIVVAQSIQAATSKFLGSKAIELLHEHAIIVEPDYPIKILKTTPESFTLYEHEQIIDHIFNDVESVKRKDLVHALKSFYKVGSNKIEMRGGFLNYLVGSNLIYSNGTVFLSVKNIPALPKAVDNE